MSLHDSEVMDQGLAAPSAASKAPHTAALRLLRCLAYFPRRRARAMVYHGESKRHANAERPWGVFLVLTIDEYTIFDIKGRREPKGTARQLQRRARTGQRVPLTFREA